MVNRSNERSRRREAMRRQLRGRPETCRPEPDDVPDGEVHVYTDGFGDKFDFNVNAIPPGNQTSNRAEITAIILAMRKSMS